MSHRGRAATFGCTLLLLSLGASLPARAAAGISLDLPQRHHLLNDRLTFAGSPGDVAGAPLMHPLLGEAIAGVGAGLITIPLMLLAGVAMQNDSPDFLVAGLPPIILFMAVPAVGVSFAEWGAGRLLGAEVHVQPAVYVGLGVQLLAFLGGAFLGGVGPKSFASMAIFSAVDAVVLAGAVLGTMTLQASLAPPPAPAPAAAPPPAVEPETAPPAAAPAASEADTHASRPALPPATGFTLFAGAF